MEAQVEAQKAVKKGELPRLLMKERTMAVEGSLGHSLWFSNAVLWRDWLRLSDCNQLAGSTSGRSAGSQPMASASVSPDA